MESCAFALTSNSICQIKGRHAFDPKSVSVNVTGGIAVKEFFHVFDFPSLLDFCYITHGHL